MQVTIGIKHASRELSLETSDSQEKVLAAVADAETKAVTLTDDRGRKVFVPAGSLAYVELGEAEPRRSASVSEPLLLADGAVFQAERRRRSTCRRQHRAFGEPTG